MSVLTIFEQLRRAGCTVTGTLALMGNWQEESGLEACRLQGDFQPDRWPSKNYAERVDSGAIPADQYYRDGKGWGLTQLTFWTRKKGFLEYCRRKGCSIADEAAQVEFAVAELKTEYASLWSFLCTCSEDQLYTATERVCREFERPAYNNVLERFAYAKALRDTIQSKAVESIDNTVVIQKTETSWPPRMICKGMFGDDVAALQALLRAHGYTLSDSPGIFGDSTETATRKYQADNGLDADGICGPKTWAAITKL